MSRIAVPLLLLLLSALPAVAGNGKPAAPSPRDKCPVCGMFVAKYRDFAAQIAFRDGTYAHFDGAKDMFKYYLGLKRYAPTRKLTDIDTVYVTDYYTLSLIDGPTAFYVIGSDVVGPMGHEFIPFKSEADAREFMKDHKGKRIVRFRDVTAPLVAGLD